MGGPSPHNCSIQGRCHPPISKGQCRRLTAPVRRGSRVRLTTTDGAVVVTLNPCHAREVTYINTDRDARPDYSRALDSVSTDGGCSSVVRPVQGSPPPPSSGVLPDYRD